MGGLQAYEWAAAYPDRVERLIACISSAWAHADLLGWTHLWAAPIRLDPNWNGGDYYGKAPPRRGLIEALKLITHSARHYETAEQLYGRAWADPAKDPAADFAHQFAIEAALEEIAAARAEYIDANSLLYLVKANQLFRAGHGEDVYAGLKRVAAPVLLIHTEEDILFPGDMVRETASVLKAAGASVKVSELDGSYGHLDGLLEIHEAGADIAAFLAE